MPCGDGYKCALPKGDLELTTDPDLHLLADGIVLPAQRIEDNVYEFALAACPQRLMVVELRAMR